MHCFHYFSTAIIFFFIYIYHLFYHFHPSPLSFVINRILYSGKSSNEKETIIKREKTARPDVKVRQKSVLLPGSPPEMAYAPPRHSYYEGTTSSPYHNAVGTELKKTIKMDESTENTRRIVTVEQTSRVIKYGDSQQETQSSESRSNSNYHQQQKQSNNYVPTPRKFVQGHFRESDYESDVEASRIRARWAPTDSETEEPRYRKVQPPKTKSPIITWPSESENERSESERHTSYVQIRNQNDDILRPGSPPEYAYAPSQEFKKTANRKTIFLEPIEDYLFFRINFLIFLFWYIYYFYIMHLKLFLTY